MPINVDSLSSYPDFFALGVTLIFSGDKIFFSINLIKSHNMFLVNEMILIELYKTHIFFRNIKHSNSVILIC